MSNINGKNVILCHTIVHKTKFLSMKLRQSKCYNGFLPILYHHDV